MENTQFRRDGIYYFRIEENYTLVVINGEFTTFKNKHLYYYISVNSLANPFVAMNTSSISSFLSRFL